jgi:hypothetical protein
MDFSMGQRMEGEIGKGRDEGELEEGEDKEE